MALRLIASCVLALLLVVPSTASAQSLPILYRIFLEGDDGLTSYGDYARVGDRVIFSLPVALRTAGIGYRTQLMSLPSSRVDWEMTERYAESARDMRTTPRREASGTMRPSAPTSPSRSTRLRNPATRRDRCSRPGPPANGW